MIFLCFLPVVPERAPEPVNAQIAEAVNSTAIKFTWKGPLPSFINGINQGYKVRNDDIMY